MLTLGFPDELTADGPGLNFGLQFRRQQMLVEHLPLLALQDPALDPSEVPRHVTMLKLLLGDPNARKLKRYQPIVSDINLLEEEIALSATMSCAARRLPSRSGWPTPAA